MPGAGGKRLRLFVCLNSMHPRMINQFAPFGEDFLKMSGQQAPSDCGVREGTSAGAP
jgi:hypothetical protein